MGANSSDPDAFKALVDEKMLLIFEACSFQDITGQRVAKVIETLEHIEARVSRFAAAIHAKDLDTYVNEKERERAERRERLMLNGPASNGQGMAQSDVDRLLG
jgi:chemotaxis protein CheZ